MPSYLRRFLQRYLALGAAKEVREIYFSRAILDFAVAAVAIFEPIYLYQVGFSIPQILLFFGAVYLVYIFLLPLGACICRRHGYEHTMLFSSPFLVLYYLSFLAIPQHPAWMVAAVLALAIQKVLYWPSFHADFATYSKLSEEGREVSNMGAVTVGVGVVAPALGGLLAATFGFSALFVVVSLLILASNIPMLRTPEAYEPRRFSYFDAWRRLFARRNRRRLWTLAGFGGEFVAMFAWPLYIVIAVPSVVTVGVIIAAANLVNTVVLLYVGRVVDEDGIGKPTVVRRGAVYMTLAWLVRPFMVGSLGIFLIDAFYRFANSTMAVPLVAQIYEEAKLSSDGVMEEIVFMEMGLGLAKASAAALFAALLWLWPGAWTAVFVLTAAFTALFATIRDRRAT
jgi:MFS family permease